MENKDYYKVLGIDAGATGAQIKEAFRRKALQFHPDRNRDDPEAASMMKSINEAYAVLSDPAKRQQYDRMRKYYGDAAHSHFRQSYSEQDIFKGSDLQQIFEEMARAFGLRGFDEIFKEFYGQGYRSFEFRRPGMYGRGFVYHKGLGRRPRGNGQPQPPRFVVGMARKLLQKVTGIQIPERGADIQDVIELPPEFAIQGGPYAYYHRRLDKKLMVQIPPGVKEGQRIRLAGMGKQGRGGGQGGDLYLRVRIKRSLIKRLKSIIGLDGSNEHS